MQALERGAAALREIRSSSNAKTVLELTREQERTKAAEAARDGEVARAQAAQMQAEGARIKGEEDRKSLQQKAQHRAQLLEYEDQLARRRAEENAEAAKRRKAEQLSMQEQSAQRIEAMKRQAEEEAVARRRAEDRQRLALEQERDAAKAKAEAEGRIKEGRENADIKMKQLLEVADADRKKLMEALELGFKRVGEGVSSVLDDQSRMAALAGGVALMAVGVYGAREGARLARTLGERVLGQPSLVRESSRRRPWARGTPPPPPAKAGEGASTAAAAGAGGASGWFPDVVLAPSLSRRMFTVAQSLAGAQACGGNLRNVLMYGPPGTGKTLAARELARRCGLEYAIMSGGDVAPLGRMGAARLHEVFDWAQRSNKGLLLFVDEADAFLADRAKAGMTEDMRAALNATLMRTGDAAGAGGVVNKISLVLATNRPQDLDAAVHDRMDEMLEFPLPQAEERVHLLKLYFKKLIATPPQAKFLSFAAQPATIKIDDQASIDGAMQEVAALADGWSGREIAKYMSSVQAEAYVHGARCDADMLRRVAQSKIDERAAKEAFALKSQKF